MSNLDKQHKLLKESYKIMQIKKLMEGLSKESKQKLLKEEYSGEDQAYFKELYKNVITKIAQKTQTNPNDWEVYQKPKRNYAGGIGDVADVNQTLRAETFINKKDHLEANVTLKDEEEGINDDIIEVKKFPEIPADAIRSDIVQYYAQKYGWEYIPKEIKQRLGVSI